MKKLLGIEYNEDGGCAWRNNGGIVERRFLNGGGSGWWPVAATSGRPRTPEQLREWCNARGFGYAQRAVARIFQEPTGLFYFCDDDGACDARGPGFKTKTEALREASLYFTHARFFGSNSVKSLEVYRLRP